MSEAKARPARASVRGLLEKIIDPQSRADALTILDLFEDVPRLEAALMQPRNILP